MSQTEEFRANLIEVGRDAMGRNDGWRWWHPRHLARLLDVWEPLIRADERRKAAEEIARRIERMVPAHPKTWNGKWLVGRRMAADEARRIGGAS